MRDLPMPGSPESSTTRPSPALGLIPTAQQQLDLLLPANERGQRARAPRLEPADAGRLAAHLPRLHRLRQPLHLVGTERAAVEHPPHQPPRAGRDNDLARRRHGLQPRRQVRRLADRNTLPCVAGPRLLADDNEPGGDADARLKGHAGRGLQRADRVEDGKAGAHGLLGVMLMSGRVAEIDEHAIAQVLGDKSVKSRHHIGDHLVEGGDQIVHVLGVKTCRKRHRADHIANHDRQLSPLGAARADRHRRRCRIAPRCGALGVGLLLGVPANGPRRNRRPVGLRQRGLGDLLDSGRSARRLCAAKLGDERPGCRIGLRVQLALEQRNEVLVVLERFGLASRGGQRLYDQPMGVLAHVVEREARWPAFRACSARPAASSCSPSRTRAPRASSSSLSRSPVSHSFQALFADGNVVDQPAPVEIGCRTQRIAAALTDQGLEPADIASDGRRIERYDLAVALESVLAEHLAQPGEGLAQVLLGLRVEVGAPQQGRQPLTRLRLGRRAGQIGQQARKLLARQVDNAIRSGQLEASQQRKTKPWGRRAVHWRTRDSHSDALPGSAFYALLRRADEK